MSLENLKAVDAIGCEKQSDYVVLSLIDAWDWEQESASGHLEALQTKLENYLEFILGGQLQEAYPLSIGRKPVIDIIYRVRPPQVAIDLLQRASVLADERRIELRHRYLPSVK